MYNLYEIIDSLIRSIDKWYDRKDSDDLPPSEPLKEKLEKLKAAKSPVELKSMYGGFLHILIERRPYELSKILDEDLKRLERHLDLFD